MILNSQDIFNDCFNRHLEILFYKINIKLVKILENKIHEK